MNVLSNLRRIHSGARAFLVRGLTCASLALLFAACIPASNVQAEETTKTPLAKADKVKLEAMLTLHLQDIVDRQKRLEGQGKYVRVRSVKYDDAEAVLYVDLGKLYVPRRYSFEFLDSLRELSLEISETVRDIVPFRGTRFLYDGKDIYYYFPDEPHEPPISRTAVPNVVGARPLIMVSAGHGAYYNYGSPAFGAARWTEQRDPYNGIIEDYITPGYAIELSNWLYTRSNAATAFTRSFSDVIHTPSNRPWWKVAARYHLASLYPNYPNIWHSRPNDTDSERERKEDLQSRPYLANHLRASTLLHVHTNGATTATPTGTRVFYQTGRIADRPLGDSILCYMKELIHAQPAYANFAVAAMSEEDNNAETQLATMRTVVIETAFHTNPNDALALQDPAFRTAAMKGVEKGYRLNLEGKTTCEPFKTTSIPNVSGPRNTSIPVKHYYTGYPQFPIKRNSVVVSCPVGMNSCSGGEAIFDSGSSPLTSTAACGSAQGTVRMRVTLTDADGVQTNPMEYSFTCT